MRQLGGDARRTNRWIVGVIGASGVGMVAALCALQSLGAANGVAFALVMRHAVDEAVAGAAEGFRDACVLFAALLLLQVGLRCASRALSERARSAFENRLRARALHDVLARPYAEVERAHTGELLTRMTSDVSVVADAATTLVPTGVSMGVRLVGVVGALFALVPQLTGVLLIAGCIAAAASVAVRPLIKRLHARMQQAEGSMRAYVQECLDSLLVVHAFGRERKVEREAGRAMDAHRRARLRKADVSNGCSTLLSALVQAGYIAGFAWCGLGILHGTASYGTLVAVVQLIGQLQAPFSSLGGTFSRYSSMLASAERLMALAGVGAAGAGAAGEREDAGAGAAAGAAAGTAGVGEDVGAAGGEQSDAADAERTESLACMGQAAGAVGSAACTAPGVVGACESASAVAGAECGVACAEVSAGIGSGTSTVAPASAAVRARVGSASSSAPASVSAAAPLARLRGISFRYAGGEPVLRDCSFAVRPGEFVGLAGPSGAGKSTLVKLLLGAYAPDAGEALAADGSPLAAARGLFAYVPQGNHLMAGTIRDIVAFADEDAAQPDAACVRAACEAACAWEFVAALPDGLDTVLGQHGSGLSEGQTQRLAVARAVYSGAPVLLLDEATSALDAPTERRMLERLRALPKRAAVVVTHRPATLAACDRVVELRAGRCVDAPVATEARCASAPAAGNGSCDGCATI